MRSRRTQRSGPIVGHAHGVSLSGIFRESLGVSSSEVEQGILNPYVEGSIPSSPSNEELLKQELKQELTTLVSCVELDKLKFNIRCMTLELARAYDNIARLQKQLSDANWQADYVRDTYITPNWKADGQW